MHIFHSLALTVISWQWSSKTVSLLLKRQSTDWQMWGNDNIQWLLLLGYQILKAPVNQPIIMSLLPWLQWNYAFMLEGLKNSFQFSVQGKLGYGADNAKVVGLIPLWAIHLMLDQLILVGPSQHRMFCGSDV